MFARLLCAALATLALTTAHAQAPVSAADQEMEASAAVARAAQIEGPSSVTLGSQAILKLPDGFAYIPPKESARLMRAMGNQTDDAFLGLVVGGAMNGFVSIRFENAGYVKDDEAREWNADELLQNLQEGTEAGNTERRQRGIPEFVVAGWVEKPAYDAATHRLVWSAQVRDKNPTANSSPGVNYNTYQLGREGYISMNLVTDLAGVETQKPLARQLLAGLDFNAGKRYADFDASTDKVAAYGLAALVGGIAAKKLGLLAMAGVFLLKFWKIGVLAVAGGAMALRKFFGRKKEA